MEKQPYEDALDRALTDLYRTAVPEGFSARWRAAVQREELEIMHQSPKARKPHRRSFLRALLPAAAALVLVLGAITAGNLVPTTLNPVIKENRATYSAQGDMAPTAEPARYSAASPVETMMWDAAESMAANNADYAAGSEGSMSAGAGGTQTGTAQGAQTKAKIVRTVDLALATTQFDADTRQLQSLTESLGGYVASVSVSGEASARRDRSAYYSLRIPSDQLDAFLQGVGSIGRITSRYESATDMSTQYADTTMRLTTQKEKMARLQQLLAQASDVSDLLEIESEIADTQYNIDSLESSLRSIDRDVDYSAVTVSVLEQSVQDTANTVELTLWERIQSGFAASIGALGQFVQNLLVFLAMAAPVILPLAVLAVAAWLLRRAWRKAHPKHEALPFAAATPDASADPAPQPPKQGA